MHGPLGLQPPSTDADQAKAADNLFNMVVLPQFWDLEGVQEISSTQELQLRGGA